MELISKCKLSEYVYRYVRRPKPILVCDFTQGELAEYDINIRGSVEFNADKPCELSETIQNEILIRAVSLAKVSYNAGCKRDDEEQHGCRCNLVPEAQPYNTVLLCFMMLQQGAV